ncbi:ATP-binding protein [Streptomyces sp. BYX5S]
MEPLTEHRPVNGPVVYGYLRLVRVPAARQAALTASLAAYCDSHELLLSGLFLDREIRPEPFSAAFTGLLDVLELPGHVASGTEGRGNRARPADRGRRFTVAAAPSARPRREEHPAPKPRPRSRSGGRVMSTRPIESAQQFFDARPEAVRQARKFATAALARWGLQDRAEDIRTCVSELATNALLHGTVADRGFLVRLDADEDVVRLEVHDSRSQPPKPRQAAETDVTGRGLTMVDALADGWGVMDRDPLGKIVWTVFKTADWMCG